MNSDSSAGLLRLRLILCFIFFSAAVRVLPHPWNFTPIGAMAIFSGAKLANTWAAFLMPLSALLLGDLFVGFHKLMLIVYLSFSVNVLFGRYIRGRQTVFGISVATLAGAVQFFLITNFAVWAYGYTLYPKSPAGLLTGYIAGILFGAFALAGRLAPTFSANDATLAAW